MVRDDPKLPDDSGEVPKSNGVVGGSIHGREIISLLEGTSQVVMHLMCFKKRQKEKYVSCIS
jgi:hypothetical protein